jgi:hypothetical protein
VAAFHQHVGRNGQQFSGTRLEQRAIVADAERRRAGAAAARRAKKRSISENSDRAAGTADGPGSGERNGIVRGERRRFCTVQSIFVAAVAPETPV